MDEQLLSPSTSGLRRMRIVIVVTEFPKITETFTLREAMELRRLGADVRICYLTRYRAQELVHEFARPLLSVSHGSNYLFEPAVAAAVISSIARALPALTRIIADLCKGYVRNPVLLAKSLALLPKCLRFARDVQFWGATHVHASFAGHPATAAWIIRRVTGIPYSISCHAHDIFRDQSMLAEKFGEASFVRTISEYNAAFLRKHLGATACARLVVLHCGVESADAGAPSKSLADKFRILFVGSLQPRKGVDVLLRSLAGLQSDRPWILRIAGDGAMRHALERRAQEAGLGGKVMFLGNQSAEQVSRLYSESDLLVVPSIKGPGGRAEGIPTVIMEALNHGCPVIASRLTGIPELVRHNETGFLFEPGDDRQLAGLIRYAMRHPDILNATALCGQRLVAREFSLQKNVRSLFSLMNGGVE